MKITVTPDDPYLPCLRGVELRPVFIIGMHRSGTTLLNRMLAVSGAFNVTSLFHIVNRQRLLRLHFLPDEREVSRSELAAYLRDAGVHTRAYDSMTVGVDETEEYAFALDYQGRWPLLNERNLPGFLTFARKVQFVQNQARPLLLKSPYDVINFAYLRKVFPAAPLVFIHRNPIEVANSQYRMYRNVIDHRDLYEALLSDGLRALYDSPTRLALTRLAFSERLEILFWLVCRRVIQACSYLTKHAASVDGPTVTVTYPELCTQPALVVRRVLACAGTEARVEPDYQSMIRIRESKLHSSVLRHQQRIEKHTRAYRERFKV
jgi:hypothetical protein